MPAATSGSPAYRSINPQSRVPTLVHDGQRFTQSLAIIEYLDEMYHQPALLPRDPEARARVRMLSQIIACDIQPLQNTSTMKYLRETLKLDDAAADCLAARMDHARAGRVQCAPRARSPVRQVLSRRYADAWRTAAWCRRCSPRSDSAWIRRTIRASR